MQQGYDSEWNIQMKKWHEIQDEYKNDVLGAFAILWTQFMTSVLQRRIEQLSDYSSRIHNNPIALLVEIKSQINENTYSIHPAILMLQSLKRLISTEQAPEQSVTD